MATTRETTSKATYRRCLDAINAGVWEVMAKTIDEVFEPDVLFHSPLPTPVTGAAAVKEVFAVLHEAFPDLLITAGDLIEEGDKLVSRQTVTGTHQGEFMGLPPTGKPVTYDEIFVFRFADGRVAETWGVVDVLSLIRQLGLSPAQLAPRPADDQSRRHHD